MMNLTPTVFVIGPEPSLRASLASVIRRAGLLPKPFVSADEFLAQPPLVSPSCLVLEVAVFDLMGWTCWSASPANVVRCRSSS